MAKTGPEKKSGESKSPDNRGPDNRGSTVIIIIIIIIIARADFFVNLYTNETIVSSTRNNSYHFPSILTFWIHQSEDDL